MNTLIKWIALASITTLPVFAHAEGGADALTRWHEQNRTTQPKAPKPLHGHPPHQSTAAPES
jgi:hypothetical protein